jgi:hypothetical protein
MRRSFVIKGVSYWPTRVAMASNFSGVRRLGPADIVDVVRIQGDLVMNASIA